MEAQTFRWDDAYNLGIAAVDDQHREFFRLANALLAAEGQEEAERRSQGTLDDLIDYACYHFHTEEEMLALQQYPEELFRAHKKEHRFFTEKVKALRQNVYDNEEIANDTIQFMTHWFLNHITTRDVAYAKYFKQHPGSPPA